MRVQKLFLVFLILGLIVNLLGCEAFTRKFTRKSKKDKAPEPMVLMPEEYKGPNMTQEELYRQYFLFWKSWHDELVQSLTDGKNHKKQIDCANEALKNLYQLRAMLNPERQPRLDNYIRQTQELKAAVAKDLYGNDLAINRQRAERIRRNILKDFVYPKIKNSLA
jgi:hypothetical protein